MTGALPTPGEVDYARFAAHTPHYVLSSTLTTALWPNTSFVRGIEDVAAFKRQPGKDIYLVGGARTTASLIDAALVDELRLTVHPLMAATAAERRLGRRGRTLK
jgi:dihydrofolate reductase